MTTEIQVASIGLAGPRGATGADGQDGSNGADGTNGWSPVLAVVADGTRRVLQVSDWTGGSGSKPATGSYIGAAGLVVLIADAVDVRGAAGVDGTNGTDGTLGSAAALVSSAGVVSIDVSAGNTHYTLTLTENVTSWNLTNLPAANTYRDVFVEVVQDAAAAKTCVSPATSGRTANGAWTVSSTLSAREVLGLRVFSDGTVQLYPSGVMA